MKSTVRQPAVSKNSAGKIRHIAFTMYPVKNTARARKFYEKDLGLTLTNNFRDQWIEYHLDNGCFAITTMAKDVSPSGNSGGSIAFEVDDVDAVVERLRSRNAKIKLDPFSTGGCRMAVVFDPEGNVVSIHAKNPDRR